MAAVLALCAFSGCSTEPTDVSGWTKGHRAIGPFSDDGKVRVFYFDKNGDGITDYKTMVAKSDTTIWLDTDFDGRFDTEEKWSGGAKVSVRVIENGEKTPPSITAPSWEKGDVVYTDENGDGKIDHKNEVTDSESATNWIDTDHDGYFDREVKFYWGEMESETDMRKVRVPSAG